MTSFISKIIGGVMVRVLLTIIPLVSMVCMDSIKYERMAWNAVENYVDIITDKGSITVDDFDKFVQKLGATGKDWTVTIQRETRKVYKADVLGNVKYVTTGVWRSDFNNIQEIHNCNKGDIVTVTIEAISIRKSETIVNKFLKVWKPANTITLLGMCRNDAALITAQIDGHLDTYGRATIKPDLAWYAYKKVLLSSFQIDSEANIDKFDSYASAVLIAVNDGYFLHMKDIKNVYRFSQELPYARSEGGTYYADTMNGTYIYTINSNASLKGDGNPENDSIGNVHDTVAIKQELVGAMNYLVEEANLISSSWGGKRFYLPKQFLDDTLYSAVTFKGLSFMVLVQDFDMLPINKLEFHTISNSQLVETKTVACYSSLYCWSKDYTGTPEMVFDNPDEAAKNGSNPDPNKFK